MLSTRDSPDLKHIPTERDMLKKDIPRKWKQKESWCGNTYFRQIDFRQRLTRDKEENYIMIMGKIEQEDKIIVNIYAPNTRKPRYIKQLLIKIKGETDNNVITVGDLNVSLTSIYRSSIEKINKKTLALNDTLDWIDYIHVCVCVCVCVCIQNIQPQSSQR